MLENLSHRLSRVDKTMRGEARLTEANTQEMLREIRIALPEADVARPAVRESIDNRKEKSLGELGELMGGASRGLDLSAAPPAVVLMAGLQGAGKTTTVGKLAKWLRENQKKKVLTVSCDVYRPAAIEQLRTVAAQAGADFFASN